MFPAWTPVKMGSFILCYMGEIQQGWAIETYEEAVKECEKHNALKSQGHLYQHAERPRDSSDSQKASDSLGASIGESWPKSGRTDG